MNSKKTPSVLLNEKGIAALGMAVIAIVVVSAISLTLPRYLVQSSNAAKDYRRQMMFQEILTQLGQVAYSAWQTSRKFANNCALAAGTTAVNLGGDVFCFPDANGNGVMEGAECITHPQLSVPVCLDAFVNLVAEKDPSGEETTLTAKINKPESFWSQVTEYANNMTFPIYKALDDSLNVVPKAYAFDNLFGRPTLPLPGTVITQINVPNCPGGLGCVQCNDANVHCIRLRICDPHRPGGCPNPEDYFYQRIAIFE
ncbi:MAG: hypothetical protein KDD61_00380 [Bdellovibrionales bacterium]|nr:hypothetical protein [Bdellovibrionales bacterium]